MGSDPFYLAFGSSGVKDTLSNLREVPQFVANIVTMHLLERMNMTSGNFPRDEDEFGWAGLTPTPSMARPAQTDIAAPSRTSAMDAAVPSPMGVNSSGNVASNTVTTTAHSTPDTAAATIPGHTTATAATASGGGGGGGGTAAGTYDASSSPTNNDNRGRWGWVGIFGLLGLFGLRRDRSYRTVTIDETRAEPTVHTHV